MEADINYLVLGYLKENDFDRTAREFEWESRSSKKGIMNDQLTGKEYLMPHLGQIIQDYCTMKKVESELRRKGKSSCILSLWRQFDALINQMKLLTMGRQASQSTRKSKYRSLSNAYYKRVSGEATPHFPEQHPQVDQPYSSSTSTTVEGTSSCYGCEQNLPAPQDLRSASQESLIELRGSISDLDASYVIQQRPQEPDSRTEEFHKSFPFTESIGEVNLASPLQLHDETSSSEIVKDHCNKSPKRKRIRPKKLENTELPLHDSELPEVDDQLQRKDNHYQPLTQQTSSLNQTMSCTSELNAILDALLNSKSLQEKIADNINKVATSSQMPPNDNEGTQGAAVANNFSTLDIEEVMNITQSDPSFDSLFASLDNMETSPSLAQTSIKPLESDVAASVPSSCESLQCGGVISKQIEELDSKRSFLTTGEGDTLSGCLAGTMEHIATDPSRQKNIKSSHLTKDSPATVPTFTPLGFRSSSINIYVKRKSNIESGTWRPPPNLANRVVLSGSGAISRSKLNQSFGCFSDNGLQSREEATPKSGGTEKGESMMKNCNKRMKRSSKKCIKTEKVKSTSSADVAPMTLRSKVRRKREDNEVETGSLDRPANVSMSNISEFQSATAEISAEVNRSEDQAANTESPRWQSSSNSETEDRFCHSRRSDDLSDQTLTLESQESVKQHTVLLRNREVTEVTDELDEISKNKTEEGSSENQPCSEEGSVAALSTRIEHSDSDTLVSEVNAQYIVDNVGPPAGTYDQRDFSSLELLASLGEKHHKSSRPTVRFDLPDEVLGTDEDDKTEFKGDSKQKSVSNNDDRTTKTLGIVEKILPIRSILKKGNASRVSVHSENIRSCHQSSIQGADVALERRRGARKAFYLKGEKSDSQSETSAQESTTGASTAHGQASACQESGNADQVDLECKEKICYTEKGDLISFDHNEIRHSGLRLIDNRVEYTIKDLEYSSTPVSMTSKKSSERNKKRRNGSMKSKRKGSTKKAEMPENEKSFEGNPKLVSDSQEANYEPETSRGDSSNLGEVEKASTDECTVDKTSRETDGTDCLSLDGAQVDSVEVDIVFETTTQREPLAFAEQTENNSVDSASVKESTAVKEHVGTSKTDEKLSIMFNNDSSSAAGEKMESNVELEDNSREFSVSENSEIPVDSLLQHNQSLHQHPSNDINQPPNHTSADLPRLSSHKSSITDVVALLNRFASDKEKSQVNVYDTLNFRNTSVQQVPAKEGSSIVQSDSIEVLAQSGIGDSPQNTESHQNDSSSSNTGFQIVSRKISSEPYESSSSGKSNIEKDPQIFTIYLSDDSNECVDSSRSLSGLSSTRQRQISGRIVEESELSRSNADVVGAFNENKTFGSQSNDTTVSRKANSLMHDAVESVIVDASSSKDTKETSSGHAFEGDSAENMNYDVKNLLEENDTKAIGMTSKSVPEKRNKRRSNTIGKSKKRKSSAQDSQASENEESLVKKVRASSQGFEVPKNLNIDQFLSRLNYTP